MQVWFRAVSRTLLPVCLLSFSTTSLSLSQPERERELNRHAQKGQSQFSRPAKEYTKVNRLIRENRMDFSLSSEALSRGSMQMNVTKVYRGEGNWFHGYKDWDIDKVYKDFDPEDSGGKAYMTLGKSVIVYENKSPDDLISHLLQPVDGSTMSYGLDAGSDKVRDFQKAACDGSEVLEILPGLLKTKRSIPFIGDIYSEVHFRAYSSIDAFLDGEGVRDERLERAWKKRAAEVALKLKLITTTYSSKNGLTPSEYSVGGRTVNFYYDIDHTETLHVSYKIVSFRNIKNWGFLGVHQKTIDSQYEGTFKSLKKIAALKF